LRSEKSVEIHANDQCSENIMNNYQLTRNWQRGQLINRRQNY